MSFSMSSINYVVGRVYPFDRHFDVLTLSVMSQQAQAYVKGYWGKKQRRRRRRKEERRKKKMRETPFSRSFNGTQSGINTSTSV